MIRKVILFLVVLELSNIAIASSKKKQSDWDIIEKYDSRHSQSLFFSSSAHNFTCPAVPCEKHRFKNSFSYFMVATSHASAFEILVFRVCKFLQTCIKHNHMFVTLHHKGENDDEKIVRNMLKAEEFLGALQISHNSWPGAFTSNTKMVHYLESLQGLHDPSKYIFHSDLDEIVEPDQFEAALKELDRGECDAIEGYWQDRISMDGALNPIVLKDQLMLSDQFPLR